MRAQRDWLEALQRVLNSKQGICAMKKIEKINKATCQQDKAEKFIVIITIISIYFAVLEMWYRSPEQSIPVSAV